MSRINSSIPNSHVSLDQRKKQRIQHATLLSMMARTEGVWKASWNFNTRRDRVSLISRSDDCSRTWDVRLVTFLVTSKAPLLSNANMSVFAVSTSPSPSHLQKAVLAIWVHDQHTFTILHGYHDDHDLLWSNQFVACGVSTTNADSIEKNSYCWMLLPRKLWIRELLCSHCKKVSLIYQLNHMMFRKLACYHYHHLQQPSHELKFSANVILSRKETVTNCFKTLLLAARLLNPQVRARRSDWMVVSLRSPPKTHTLCSPLTR